MTLSRSFTYSLLALMALIVSSYISLNLPWNGGSIPITAQSLVVLLIGYFLGPLRGAVVISAYLFLGAMDLPVFANKGSGWKTMTGTTGGYLIGFFLAVIYVGNQSAKIQGRLLYAALVMTIGTLWILVPGVLWLSWLIGVERAVTAGFIAVLPGAVVKIVIGALVIALSYKSLKPLR